MFGKKEVFLVFCEDKISHKLSKSFPDASLQHSFYINPLCHTLSKAFEIPRKTSQTSNLSLNRE